MPAFGRRAELARFRAPRNAAGPVALHAAVKAIETPVREGIGSQDCPDASRCQPVYIEAMTQMLKGPVATEIEERLRAALSPQHLAVIDDSEKHRGHAGHDGSGESHFTVEIVAERFSGQSRVARQRLVNTVRADRLRDKVHALAIKAKAPEEA